MSKYWWIGDPFMKKIKKLKWGPFGIFQHPFCRKIAAIAGILLKSQFSNFSQKSNFFQ